MRYKCLFLYVCWHVRTLVNRRELRMYQKVPIRSVVSSTMTIIVGMSMIALMYIIMFREIIMYCVLGMLRNR